MLANQNPDAVPEGRRILALDYGQKRVGVAVSDVLLFMAHGRETLHYQSRRELLERLHAIVEQERIGLIVLGLPRKMNGTEGEMSEKVRAFMSALAEQEHLPVVPWDERLSSRQAERTLADLGKSSRQQRGMVDQLAAVFILQSYLDHLATQRNPNA